MAFKLGLLPRAYDPLVPQFTALTRGVELLPPPGQVNWTRTLPRDLGAMLNDTYGDCAEAAFGHAIQTWTENARPPMWSISDPNIERLYSQVTGFNPDDPSTDQGTILQSLLAFLVKTGAPIGVDGSQRHKLRAYVEADVALTDQVKWLTADCGVVQIGFSVPAFLMNPAPPLIWDVDPNGNNAIVGGHSVAVVGYRPQGLYVISWGQIYQMTWAFWARFVTEAYGLCDTGWITKRGTSPAGMTLAQLDAAMQAITGD
jgi:hypothetical protein